MSYVNKKTRVFKEDEGPQLRRKRSDGRMKKYSSATDVRVWSDSIEQRRQYFLDLIRRDFNNGGRLIPIEVIIKCLLAERDAENQRLKNLLKARGIAHDGHGDHVADKGKGPTMFRTEVGSDGNLRMVESPDAGGVHPVSGAQGPQLMSDSRPEAGDPESEALRAALEQKEMMCEEEREIAERAVAMLELLKDVVEEEYKLKQSKDPSATSQPSKPKTQKGSKAPERKPRKKAEGHSAALDSYKQEVEKAEHEIEELKKQNLPLKEELEEQIDILKECAEMLTDVVNQNAALREEAETTTDPAVKEDLEKLNDVTREINKMRAEIQELEKKLRAAKTSAAEDHNKELLARLEEVQGLDEEIRRLRDSAKAALDTTERDKLLAKIAELEKELENCKCKQKEIDLLQLERDCLKSRLADLCRIQKDYEELLKKTQCFEACKADLAKCQAECERLKKVEEECNQLKEKAQRAEVLEEERKLLLKEIESCECCMGSQEDEIKKLLCHINCLTENIDERQSQVRVEVCTMRATLESKESIISKTEEQLENVEQMLKCSIEGLTCETTCLRARIEELESEAELYQKELDGKEANYKLLQDRYKLLEENRKELEKNLETEKLSKSYLQNSLDKAIKNDTHLKQMLHVAKCAISCITQKLQKHDIIGIGRLEAERASYMRQIQDLENQMNEKLSEMPNMAERISELEQELMRFTDTNKALEELVEQLRSENGNLKMVSATLQEGIKTVQCTNAVKKVKCADI